MKLLLIWVLLLGASIGNSSRITGKFGRISTKNGLADSIASLIFPFTGINFLIAYLPCPEHLAKILFISPRLIDYGSEEVKYVFDREKCHSLGLLLRNADISTLISSKQSSFFGQSVAALKNSFSRRFGVPLRLVLVDAATDAISADLALDFHWCGVVMFRHPITFINGDYFYFPDACRMEQFTYKSSDLLVSELPLIAKETQFEFIEEFAYELALLTVPLINDKLSAPIATPKTPSSTDLVDIELNSSASTTPVPEPQERDDEVEYEFVDTPDHFY